MFPEAQAGADLRISGGDWSEHHANALRAFHHVRVGDDVAVGIDDDAGAETALTPNHAGLVADSFVGRAIAGDLDLNNRGGDAGGQFLKGIVELREQVPARDLSWPFGS